MADLARVDSLYSGDLGPGLMSTASAGPAPEPGMSSPAPVDKEPPVYSANSLSRSPSVRVQDLLLRPSTTIKILAEKREEVSAQVPSERLPLSEGIHLPAVGDVLWVDLRRECWAWIQHPKNMLLFLWIVAVAVSGGILFLVMTGILNSQIPRKSDRNAWFEACNQILNGLFTLLCVVLHPGRVQHAIWLHNWQPRDVQKMRKIYCKHGTRKPNEWYHMLVVVFLLNLNCVSQYCLAGLNWSYPRHTRPAIGVALCLVAAIGAAAAAGLYNILSPLGREYDFDGNASERSMSPWLERQATMSDHGKVVDEPEWRGEALRGCASNWRVTLLSSLCLVCVFGINAERLGWGNKFLHMVTFVLFLSAPFLIFNLAAINLDGDARTALGVTGIILSLFGVLYGGYWRIKTRMRYRLPAYTWCCRSANASDCTLWLFCSCCALSQEVRTAEYYEVGDHKLFVKQAKPVGEIPLGGRPSSDNGPMSYKEDSRKASKHPPLFTIPSADPALLEAYARDQHLEAGQMEAPLRMQPLHR